MKKAAFQTTVLFASTVILALLFQGCGGGSNNTVSNIPSNSGCTTGVNCVGPNVYPDPLTQFIADRSAEYQQCVAPNFNLVPGLSIRARSWRVNNGMPICKITMSGTLQRAQVAAMGPDGMSGGLNTGIQLYPSDQIQISADGHYSTYNDGCNLPGDRHHDFGRDHSREWTSDPGYLVLVDANGNRSSFIRLNHNHARIMAPPVPAQIYVGYNASSLSCGDIAIKFRITRCMDANLNTYPCE
jgi:hypothetical protein